MLIVQCLNGLGALAPGGWMASVPVMPTGKIGHPICSARRAAPVRPLCSRPSRLRVPSGKMPNSSPRWRTPAAVSSADCDLSPPDAIDGDHAHRREDVLRLPRVHVLGLADEADVARHGEHQERRVEERDVVRAQDCRAVDGQPVVAVHVDVPEATDDRRQEPARPSLERPGTRRAITEHAARLPTGRLRPPL